MFKAQLSQFFPPTPAFSEADVPAQDTKVFIVTGGSSGIGLELCKILYRKNGRIYIAGRSEVKVRQAIQAIQDATPASAGSLEFLRLDLADLSSIKAAVDDFKALEPRLHVLWNNAGVSQPPLGSLSKQGIELQLATNCLGPFLFTQLLLPLLKSTAAAQDAKDAASVRVVWTSSQMIELSAPKEGIVISELRTPPKNTTRNYVNSKTGNLFLATELARREPSVVSVALNPGAASTNLFRYTPLTKHLAWPLLHSAERAALTQLYAGLSLDITVEKNGCYIVPWGRIAGGSSSRGGEHGPLRKELANATKPVADGGTGRAAEFWDWCVEMTSEFYN
ncbi:hypothetical protein B0T26DRAFT_735257 [Lasiosphaeria miniovina]|uniref:Short-chain dehydrogenase n=1 Tax=Lasiosphaeria miniovina TaxID=1954250 RepID=A0AA39ZQQ0_9PEZI|nr:uncharacterized protein B0T26DRAFT_735257 [Lasiosphaeria miniovina]KAK0701926.1 hypothetical protein B0T26DRAFT_735257 [Lasiosphaeria miniovina]